MVKMQYITTDQFVSFSKWFKSYVESFYKDKTEEEKRIILLKEEHTYRVCQEITDIAKELHLDQKDILLAKTIALFHDIGRFPQYEKYKTFRDSVSENHALLSVKVLNEKQVLKNLSPEVQKLILKSIEYHNVKKLPDNLPQRLSFFSKLIRDADKLDIFYVFIKSFEHPTNINNTIQLELPEKNSYSLEIISDIFNNQISDLKFMHCKNDMKLMLLSWIFDINFKPTFIKIKERKYIEKIINFLPNTEDIKKVAKHIEKYITAHI